MKQHSDNEVRSAGTNPSKLAEWQTVGEVPDGAEIIQAMKEEGIDISGKHRKVVTKEDIKWADKIYVMAHKEDVPNFVISSGKTEFWDIEDPKGKNIEETQRIVAEIKGKVSAMAR